MQRARRSTLSMLVVGFALLGVIGVTPFSMPAARRAAAVGWPPSVGAVVAEVVTGGASASDEYVEIANAGATTIDLQNVELLYVSAAGTSPTRKVAWTAGRPLAPGQHLLVANASGAFAAVADATYTSGLAATGGTVALRVIGGAVIDAVGWGDATNAFVEGSPAAPPGASASVERRPGGENGNRTDTNDNASDFVVQAHPVAQNLASPVVAPSPTPSGSPPSPSQSDLPTAEPSVTAAPTASAPPPTPTSSTTDTPAPITDPTPSLSASEPPVSATTVPVPTDPPSPSSTEPIATPTPTPFPTDTLAPTDVPVVTPVPTVPPDPVPTPEPVVTPDPTAPASDPPATPTPAPSASRSASVVAAVAAARSAPDGTRVTVEGVLTTSLGAFDEGRGAFVQDDSGGIALYLDAPSAAPLPRGTRVRVTGAAGERYSQRVLRVAGADVTDLGGGVAQPADALRTGDATESFEGRRVEVEGIVTVAPTDVADGASFTIDDGSGPVRVVGAALPEGVVRGALVRATGPLGQRDSSGTGIAGYRVYAMDPGDIVVLAVASPSPVASASPSPTPLSSASPSASPSPSASASPSPSPSLRPSPSATAVATIAAARGLPAGTRVRVRGVVTAEAGRVGPSLVSIQDATAGLAVHLPSGSAVPARGAVVDVVGDLAAPYGQLEVRPAAGTWRSDGSADLPAPAVIAGELDESLEGLLVSVQGSVVAAPTTATAGDLSFDVDLAGGARVRVQADASSGIPASAFVRGRRFRLVGIVGQRASASGRLYGYRVWLRDPADVTPLDDPSPSPSASPSSTPRPSATVPPSPVGSPTPGPSGPAVVTISAAILSGGPVVVEGVVVAGSGLLDAEGRAIVLQDASAAIMVRLPAGAAGVRPGRRLRIAGESGRSYGAPRILASTVADRGAAQQPSPVALHAPPTAAVEWRLVRVSGVVRSVHRDGSAWKAELAAGGTLFLVEALAGAAIPADRLRAGATATIVGIARRPYPTARDRRLAILPRSAADVTVTASGAGGADTSGTAASPRRTGGPAATGRSAATGRPAASPARAEPPRAAASAAPLDVDLVDLPASAGRIVRVGGFITSVDGLGIVIDDGTATARVDLAGDAVAVLPQLVPGLAVNLIGAAETGPGPRLAVTRAEDVIPVANPETPVDASPSPPIASAPPARPSATDDAFGLSGSADSATDEPAPPAGGVVPVVALLLGLALVGVVALLLRRRPPIRQMAHPLPGGGR